MPYNRSVIITNFCTPLDVFSDSEWVKLCLILYLAANGLTTWIAPKICVGNVIAHRLYSYNHQEQRDNIEHTKAI